MPAKVADAMHRSKNVSMTGSGAKKNHRVVFLVAWRISAADLIATRPVGIENSACGANAVDEPTRSKA